MNQNGNECIVETGTDDLFIVARTGDMFVPICKASGNELSVARQIKDGLEAFIASNARNAKSAE